MNDYTVHELRGNALRKVRTTLTGYFLGSTEYFSKMSDEDYQNVVAMTQDALNRQGMVLELAGELTSAIRSALGEWRFLVQSNLYLRAVRPHKGTDYVGWHRESFYGGPLESYNCWIPIANVDADNGLYYIPGSAEIPLERLEIVETSEAAVPRYSAGHRTGLLYAPKKIVNGITFSTKERMKVRIGEAALFSGELVHGAGSNDSEWIRFSVDFRVLPWSAREKMKSQQHFSSGLPQFIEI